MVTQEVKLHSNLPNLSDNGAHEHMKPWSSEIEHTEKPLFAWIFMADNIGFDARCAYKQATSNYSYRVQFI